MQDNWKVNRRLTLDYGMRFNWIQPQYDQRCRASSSIRASMIRRKTVRLYQRSCAPGTFPCARQSTCGR